MQCGLFVFVSDNVQGFLTPQELFYVRNHGPVPLVDDEDIPNWEITIEGLESSFIAFSVNC